MLSVLGRVLGMGNGRGVGRRRNKDARRADECQKHLVACQERCSQSEVSSPNGRHARQTDDLVAALALEVWRLRRRVDRMTAALGEDAVRPLHDSLLRFDDVMAAHDLAFEMHDGERYIDGSSLEVIHIQDKGEPRVVIETIQPTIRFPDRILRNGQVVIGAASEKGEGAS